MRFYVGQPVICVDDSHSNKDYVKELQRGAKYVIRWEGDVEFDMDRHKNLYPPEYCVRINGIYRDITAHPRWDDYAPRETLSPIWQDVPFRASRFRPLDESEESESMKMLRGILKNAKEPVGVD